MKILVTQENLDKYRTERYLFVLVLFDALLLTFVECQLRSFKGYVHSAKLTNETTSILNKEILMKETIKMWLKNNAGYILSTLFGIGTVFLFFGGEVKDKKYQLIIVAIWAILPPIWFWVEFALIRKPKDANAIEELKYRQELNRNIWAAITTILVILYFKEP